MQRLQPPDSHHLSAALGWLDLGSPGEAFRELKKIAPASASHPDVLEVRWLVCSKERKWDEAVVASRELLRVASDQSRNWLHHAYALRRATGGGLQAAWDVLRPAWDKFPDEPTIAYNLSCYACQMEQLDEARKWFQCAVQAGDKSALKFMALSDQDLQPLWKEISEL
ncbi:MAG: tetratricopeptide repeat protein [Verrucomicrobiota bacterium]